MQVSISSRSARVIVRMLAATMICAPVALLASCGGKPGPRMAVMRVTHRLTENKPHETDVVVGGELANDLPFSAGTGYAWTAKGFDAKVLALKSQESRSEAADGVAGGPMIEHFVFEGMKPGETTITFELRRPWEKDVAPAETRTMKVKVVKATN
ncbi:MAG: protease inhibitor I42 family protein [Planctomycetaceae bacterium]|jgi:predicted secreted protein|nr:protease inhibitor I42 family protein [Planctomycetaceae bacterium]